MDVVLKSRTDESRSYTKTGSRFASILVANRNIPSLDGLRAVAVFLVIFYHAGFARSPAGEGVLIFFVLSGFLITWLLLVERRRFDSISLPDFYWRRALRILPAFYVYWISQVCILTFLHKTINWPHALSAIFYFSNYYQGIRHPADDFLGHTWSLSIEEQFYLLWPTAFLLWAKSEKKLSILAAMMVTSAWIYRLVAILVFHRDQSYIYRAFETRVDSLMIGCLLALCAAKIRFTGLFDGLTERYWFVAITVGLLAASAGYSNRSTQYRDLIGFMLEPVLIAVLIVQCVVFSNNGPLRLLNVAPMRWLGRISYSLYLYHASCLHFVHQHLGNMAFAFQVAAGVAVTIGVAAGSYYIIERPALRLKNKISKSREQAQDKSKQIVAEGLASGAKSRLVQPIQLAGHAEGGFHGTGN